MLSIVVLGTEYFDDESEEFVYPEQFELQLEHSLVALSKWESEFEKPFLGPAPKSNEEALGYIHAMVLTPNVPRERLYLLSEDNVNEINDYINRKMSATWFSETGPAKRSSETITSELIYYWMNSFSIPSECETWHLSRLFNLIKVHSAKNEKPKKMTPEQQMAHNRKLNEERKAQLGTRG